VPKVEKPKNKPKSEREGIRHMRMEYNLSVPPLFTNRYLLAVHCGPFSGESDWCPV